MMSSELEKKAIDGSGFYRWCHDKGLKPDIALADQYSASEVERLLDALTTLTSCESWCFSPDLDSSVDYAWAYTDTFTAEETGKPEITSGTTQGDLLNFIQFT